MFAWIVLLPTILITVNVSLIVQMATMETSPLDFVQNACQIVSYVRTPLTARNVLTAILLFQTVALAKTRAM